MADEKQTTTTQQETKTEAVKIITPQELEQLKNDLKQRFDEKVDELKADMEKQIVALKESHDKVTDTTKNKYGAYFFRAVELATLACVVYSVLDHIL